MKTCKHKCGRPAVKGAECNTCRMKAYKARDIVRWYFYKHKSNAKRRQKPSTLTLEQFTKLCRRTGYIELREAGFDVTWDRIDELGIYSYDNMQILYRSDNTKKFYAFLRKSWTVQCKREESDPF